VSVTVRFEVSFTPLSKSANHWSLEDWASQSMSHWVTGDGLTFTSLSSLVRYLLPLN